MYRLIIDLKSLRILPAIIMVVFTLYISLDFTSIDMQMASYASLAGLLLSSIGAIWLIIRQRNILRYDFVMIVFCVFIIALSIMLDGNWKDFLYYTCSIMTFLFLFNYYHDNTNSLFVGAALGFFIAIFAGLFQILSHPEMLMFEDSKEVTGYLLGGNYNQIGCRVIVALLTNILCLKISKWFLVFVIPLVIASFAILFMVQSMTAVTCTFLFLFFCVIPVSRLQRMAIWCTLIGVIFFEIFVCFNGKGFENNELAVWFIVDVLGKDITFTNRTGMWDSALRVIVESPIWGYGFVTNEWYLSKMSSFAKGPHNIVLASMVYGGIIALMIYVSLFVMSLKHLLRSKERMANVVFASIVVLSFMMLMEVYPYQFIFFLLTIGIYYNKFSCGLRKEVSNG